MIKRAFKTTTDNLILTQPLIIYLIIISLTMAALAHVPDNRSFWVFFVANILLSTAFLAGWLNMVSFAVSKKATIPEEPQEVTQEDEEKKNIENPFDSFESIKYFFPGVASNFISVTVASALYVILFAAIMFAGYKLGLKFIPDPHVDWSKIIAAQTPDAMHKVISALSFAQLKSLNLWILLMGGLSTVYTFLTMFWLPAIITDTKNPLKALYINLKFIFKNFAGSVGLLIFLFALNMFYSMISVVFSLNIILTVLGLIFTFYFMTYCVVLVFMYYENKSN